jgi:tetratricopeptide (TPR) repeat protein
MKHLLLLTTVLLATSTLGQDKPRATEPDPAAQFGEAVAQAFNERDQKALTGLIDIRSLGERAARVQQLSETQQAQFVRGVESVGASRMVASYMQSMEASQGTAQFMRARATKPPRALVRLDLGQNGFDYLEYVVETRGGRSRAVDWFQLSTGELVSVTMGGVAQMFTTNDPGLLGRLFGMDKMDESAMANMRKAGEQQRAGKFAEALATLKKLPPQMQNSRILLTAQASMAVLAKQDEEYTRILAKLAQHHADDPAAAFKLVDHFFTIKDLPNILKALDTMERRVGVDGVTRQLRAAGYSVMNDFPNALKYADESIKLEPDRVGGHDIRASVLVGLGRHQDAVTEYQGLEKNFGLQFTREVFTDDPAFAQFVASAPFKAWLKP